MSLGTFFFIYINRDYYKALNPSYKGIDGIRDRVPRERD